MIASIQEVLEVNLSYGKTGYKNVQLFRNIATKRVEKWRYALYNPRLNLFRTKSGSCKRQITCEWHFNKRLFTFAARKINIGKFQHKKTNVMVVTDVAVSKRVLFSWKNVEERLQIVLKSIICVLVFTSRKMKQFPSISYTCGALDLRISTVNY